MVQRKVVVASHAEDAKSVEPTVERIVPVFFVVAISQLRIHVLDLRVPLIVVFSTSVTNFVAELVCWREARLLQQRLKQRQKGRAFRAPLLEEISSCTVGNGCHLLLLQLLLVLRRVRCSSVRRRCKRIRVHHHLIWLRKVVEDRPKSCLRRSLQHDFSEVTYERTAFFRFLTTTFSLALHSHCVSNRFRAPLVEVVPKLDGHLPPNVFSLVIVIAISVMLTSSATNRRGLTRLCSRFGFGVGATLGLRLGRHLDLEICDSIFGCVRPRVHYYLVKLIACGHRHWHMQ